MLAYCEPARTGFSGLYLGTSRDSTIQLLKERKYQYTITTSGNEDYEEITAKIPDAVPLQERCIAVIDSKEYAIDSIVVAIISNKISSLRLINTQARVMRVEKYVKNSPPNLYTSTVNHWLRAAKIALTQKYGPMLPPDEEYEDPLTLNALIEMRTGRRYDVGTWLSKTDKTAARLELVKMTDEWFTLTVILEGVMDQNKVFIE
jgi:hypothetical protein